MIHKRDDDRAVDHEPFARPGVGHVAELMGADAKLLGNKASVARRLVQKVHKIAVFLNILSRVSVQLSLHEAQKDRCNLVNEVASVFDIRLFSHCV